MLPRPNKVCTINYSGGRGFRAHHQGKDITSSQSILETFVTDPVDSITLLGFGSIAVKCKLHKNLSKTSQRELHSEARQPVSELPDQAEFVLEIADRPT